jgi:UDP-N-acetylglucosamine acyltransferase
MASRIHRTAIIHEDSVLEDDVRIGPYTVIGPAVRIGAGTQLGSHVVIESNTRIGVGCVIKPHAVIGSDAQDFGYHGEPAYIEIGDRTTIGEFAMISRGSHDDRTTRIGSDNLIMSGVHVAHDCQVGNNVILSNYVQLGGHIVVEDRAVIGGLAAFHQFCRIGTLSMVGGTAGVMQDVPPYCMVQGAPPATVRGLNRIGVRRAGVSDEGFAALKHAFRLLFRRGMTRENALDEIERLVELTPEVRHLVQFCRGPSKRGICKPEPSAGLGVVGGGPEGGGERLPQIEEAGNQSASGG